MLALQIRNAGDSTVWSRQEHVRLRDHPLLDSHEFDGHVGERRIGQIIPRVEDHEVLRVTADLGRELGDVIKDAHMRRNVVPSFLPHAHGEDLERRLGIRFVDPNETGTGERDMKVEGLPRAGLGKRCRHVRDKDREKGKPSS